MLVIKNKKAQCGSNTLPCLSPQTAISIYFQRSVIRSSVSKKNLQPQKVTFQNITIFVIIFMQGKFLLLKYMYTEIHSNW